MRILLSVALLMTGFVIGNVAVSTASAQPSAATVECSVLPLQSTAANTAASYQAWMSDQLSAGRSRFELLPGPHPVACAW